MIISASRRTDIPAFFGEWFENRLAAGYFNKINPFNPARVTRVSLLPGDVDCFVFWTKDPSKFYGTIDLLEKKGYRYYFQYTLNDYPRYLEEKLPSAEARIVTMRSLAKVVGRERIVWRYDPIALSTSTPPRWHEERFKRLAGELAGSVLRVTVSFMVFYEKVRRRLARLETGRNMVFFDIATPDAAAHAEELAARLGEIARTTGVDIASCCVPLDLEKHGIKRAACIDAGLASSLCGRRVAADPDPGQRPGCLCARSHDMGVYDTCSHGCAYCYANSYDKKIRANLLRHSPLSEALVGP